MPQSKIKKPQSGVKNSYKLAAFFLDLIYTFVLIFLINILLVPLGIYIGLIPHGGWYFLREIEVRLELTFLAISLYFILPLIFFSKTIGSKMLEPRSH